MLPTRRFVRIPEGEVHYAELGSGDPVLLLHQTPRSWREFERVLPLLAPHRRAIAMDTIGYGDSTSFADEDSIEYYATAVVRLLDALDIEHSAVVGHHTGGVIAIELAASYPERVDALVLSCTPLMDESHRSRPHRAIDDVPPSEDGSHVAELWRMRQRFYPPDRPDFLTAFLIDALKAGYRAAEGHRAVSRFIAEDKLPLVKAPIMLIAGTQDPSYRDRVPLARELGNPDIAEIEGGMAVLPEQYPERFTELILEFLQEVEGDGR